MLKNSNDLQLIYSNKNITSILAMVFDGQHIIIQRLICPIQKHSYGRFDTHIYNNTHTLNSKCVDRKV